MECSNLGVCIPTYNRNEYLKQILKTIPLSINVEVSDNGAHVTESIKMEYSNVSFVSISEEIGMFENWNMALAQAKQEYVVLPSDDDLYLEHAFETIDLFIRSNPDVDVFIFGHYNIDENNQVQGSWKPNDLHKYGAPLGFKLFKYGVSARMPSIVFRKSFLDDIGHFDNHFKITAADSELIQRALLRGTTLFIPEIISSYRIWSGGMTAQKQATKQWLEEVDQWTKKISKIANGAFNSIGQVFNDKEYSDEIRAQNIYWGAFGLYKKGRTKTAKLFIRQSEIPKNALFKTKIKLILLYLKCFFSGIVVKST